METVYDWITVAIFAGLVVLFLHRSMAEKPKDTIYHYLPPAVGCAVANYVGNPPPQGMGQGPLSALIVVAVLAHIIFVLKPFDFRT